MYEQIYNLTSMFFKTLKGNLMYEFLISKFNGKRGVVAGVKLPKNAGEKFPLLGI